MLPTRKEASLRIMFLGKTNLPTDRETLYWMNVKAIPPTDEKKYTEEYLTVGITKQNQAILSPGKSTCATRKSTKYVAV